MLKSEGAAQAIYLKWETELGEKQGKKRLYSDHVPLIFEASQVAPITPVLVFLLIEEQTR